MSDISLFHFNQTMPIDHKIPTTNMSKKLVPTIQHRGLSIVTHTLPIFIPTTKFNFNNEYEKDSDYDPFASLCFLCE